LENETRNSEKYIPLSNLNGVCIREEVSSSAYEFILSFSRWKSFYLQNHN